MSCFPQIYRRFDAADFASFVHPARDTINIAARRNPYFRAEFERPGLPRGFPDLIAEDGTAGVGDRAKAVCACEKIL
jgi:hypothetical protein